MNREEARMLLDAWDFLEKNKGSKWEGLSLEELKGLIEQISGETNPVLARAYLESVAAGQISETVPQKIIEAAKEGRTPEEKVKRTEKTISATKAWISRLRAKNADEVAEKQVATAQVKALVEEARKKEVPPAPAEEVPAEVGPTQAAGGAAVPAPAPTPPAPPPPKEAPAEATKTPGFYISIKDVPAPTAPASLERSIRRATFNLAEAPFKGALALGAAAFYEADPEGEAAAEFRARGLTSAKLIPLRQEAAQYGISPAQLDKFITRLKTMEGAPTGLVERLLSGGKATRGEAWEVIYIGREVSISPSQITGVFLAPSPDGTTLSVPAGSLIGNIFSRLAGRFFGRAASSFLGRAIGGTAAGTTIGGAAGALLTGPAAPIAAPILAAVGSKVADVLIVLKRNAREVAVVLATTALVFIAAGVTFGSSFLVGAGGVSGGAAFALGGTDAIAAGASSMLRLLWLGLTTIVVPSIAMPLAIAFLSLPIMVAIIFFIINSGAFLEPRQVTTGAQISLPFSLTGPLPAGVPTTWPLGTGTVVKGPDTSYPDTHTGAEAIDILDPVGTPIKSTTAGVASVSDIGPYGKHVEVQTTAGGTSFVVRYAHMSVISVTNGQVVSTGQVIGLVGNTGKSTAPHLHYEFKGLPMTAPLIPEAVPSGCEGTSACGVQIL